MTYTAPTIPPYGTRRGHEPTKEYLPAKWERGVDGKMRRMDIEAFKREHQARICTVTYLLYCGPKQKPVNYFCISRSYKSQKCAKHFCGKCEVGVATLNSMCFCDLQNIEAVLDSILQINCI